jgi:glyoxalase family protein
MPHSKSCPQLHPNTSGNDVGGASRSDALRAGLSVRYFSGMNLPLLGIHHVTAITARASDNLRFYTQVLGMRLVKKTVNQDDVSAYHLFYADAKGSPGTDLTFFDWAAIAPRHLGNRMITRTALRVANRTSLEWWKKHLEAAENVGEIVERVGRASLLFEDHEGQQLMLVEDHAHGTPYEKSPVPADHQIHGLGPVEITIPTMPKTVEVLTELLGMRSVRQFKEPTDGVVHVYDIGQGGPGAELHVRLRPELPIGQTGAGGVHHVAFRVPDDQYDAWADRLDEYGIPNSGKIDRFYFRSLYFREPNGILFELATDGPGFATDEPAETLGERLALPPFLEPRRAQIEKGLKPL